MIFRFAGCELDTDTRELRRDGARQPVEPQVFGVLEHLLRHHDRVVTRDELLDAVWGHRFVTDATLASRVKAARRAVGDTGADQRIIRTLRGVGLRCVADVEADHAARIADADASSERFVGRDAELVLLDRALTAAAEGHRRTVLLRGEAGVGKTALLEAFLERARRRDRVAVAVGECLEHVGADEPYLPLLDALGRLAEIPGGPDVGTTLARTAPTWSRELALAPGPEDAGPTPGATPGRMVREFLAALEAVTHDAVLVLAIEDLHWSDRPTLDALAAAARRRTPARLLIVGTYRDGGPQEAVSAWAAELAGRGAAEVIRLSALGEDLGAFCEQRLGAALAPAALDVLVERSGGHPLLAGTLLDGWVDSGALVRAGMHWAPSAPGRLERAVPASLTELLERRLASLSDDDQRLLEASAVAGRRCSAAAVAACLDEPVTEAERRLREICRSVSVLRREGSERWPDGTVADRVVFVHDLHREVLLDRLPAARGAELHRRLASRLRAAWGDRHGELAAELARHALAAGDVPLAVDELRLAAEVATARGAPREAAALLERARSLLPEWADRNAAETADAAISLALAGALVAVRGWGSDDAEAAYVRAIEMARKHDDAAALAHGLYGLATVHEYRGNYATSEELIRERLELDEVAASSDARVESHELLACSLFHQGQFAASLQHARDGIAACGRSDAAAALGEDPEASCHGWAALSLAFLGDAELSLDEVRRALEVSEQRRHGRAAALAQAARVHQHGDDAQATRDLAADALDEARRGGFTYLAAAAAVLHGWARAALGEPAGADEALSGLRDHEATGAAMDRPYYVALTADALRRHERRDEAARLVDEALGLVDAARPFFFDGALAELRARLSDRAGG